MFFSSNIFSQKLKFEIFLLIVFVPKRVLKTYFEILWIGKIRKASTRKSPYVFFKVEKNILFDNFSKLQNIFLIIVPGAHSRVLKTYSGIFRIGKIWKFQLKTHISFFLKVEKTSFLEISRNYLIFCAVCFWYPQKSFEQNYKSAKSENIPPKNHLTF